MKGRLLDVGRKFCNLLFVQSLPQREMANKWKVGEGEHAKKFHQSRNFVIDSSHPAEPVRAQSQKEEKNFINQVPSKYSTHPNQGPSD